jgi:hypothetical protein
MKKMTLLGLLVLCGFGLAGCDLLPVAIVEPEAGARLTFQPVDIELELAEGTDTAGLAVWLNDVDVSDRFEFWSYPGIQVARAVNLWGESGVTSGANRIDVFVDGVLTSRAFTTEGDPFADAVVSDIAGPGGGHGGAGMPNLVLGSPRGGAPFLGSLDVFSLGEGGSIVLRFDDNYIFDGPGVDFTVFENPLFKKLFAIAVGVPFAEPALVSVSQDGEHWVTFEACEIDPSEDLVPPYPPHCAGIRPSHVWDPDDPAYSHASIPSVTPIEEIIGTALEDFVPEGSGGDSFDLEDLGLAWVRYVEIVDIGPARGQVPTVGFDLDAVAAVNSRVWLDENENGIPDWEE